uniref:Enoyl reductase (ER) domain-containing protein n=2 Tax=Lutzomyia longipalpis TaxID=7200 RepID=A0A1B0GKN5_LUTLO
MFSVRKVFSPAVGGVLRQFFRCRENVRLGSTYRAAILTEFNKIPKIEMIKVQENLFPGQVKVGVHFCSLNDTDVRILEGTENVELPLVPGCEFSGEIVAVDPDNRLDFKVGDRVVALRGFRTSGGGLARAFQTICMSEGYAKIYRFLKNALGNRRARCIYDAVGGEALRLLEDFIDPQNGCILTAYPLFNREAFQASTPEYNVKPKDRLDRAEIDKLPPIHERIQHVDLYSYQYSDRDFFREIIEETLSLHSEDLISAHVSKIFTLDDLDDAVEFIKKKKCTGKVLIDLKEGKTKPKDDSDESDNEDKRKD